MISLSIGIVAHSNFVIPILKGLKNHTIDIYTDQKTDSKLESYLNKNYIHIHEFNKILDAPHDIKFLFECLTIIPVKYLDNSIWINLHNGILPYRKGMNSNLYAILNSDEFLGFTLHKITETVDNGPIIKRFYVKNDLITPWSKIKKNLINIIGKAVNRIFLDLNDSLEFESVPIDNKEKLVFHRKLKKIDINLDKPMANKNLNAIYRVKHKNKYLDLNLISKHKTYKNIQLFRYRSLVNRRKMIIVIFCKNFLLLSIRRCRVRID